MADKTKKKAKQMAPTEPTPAAQPPPTNSTKPEICCYHSTICVNVYPNQRIEGQCWG